MNFEAALVGFLDLNTDRTKLPVVVYLRQGRFPFKRISEAKEVQIGMVSEWKQIEFKELAWASDLYSWTSLEKS